MLTSHLDFLRIGEMTVPGKSAYDSGVHLSIIDVILDHPSSPTAMFVTIEAQKTDPFRNGVTLALGRTHRPLYAQSQPWQHTYTCKRDGAGTTLLLL